MKRKISALVLMLLFCLSAIVIIHNDLKTEATPGDGGNGDNGIGLDYDFMWELTAELSNVIHNKSIYAVGLIPKGRAWGTDGDRWTANYTKDLMVDLGLQNVKPLLIDHIDNIWHW